MPYYFTKGRGNDIAILLIGVIDVISGIIIYFSKNLKLASTSTIAFLMFFYFCLGMWSLAGNFRRRKYYDWRGVVDIINAITFTLIYYGNVYGIFQLIGVIVAIKGLLGVFLITTKE
jgi:hypothetical protein